jgi:HMG (high mobility group) box
MVERGDYGYVEKYSTASTRSISLNGGWPIARSGQISLSFMDGWRGGENPLQIATDGQMNRDRTYNSSPAAVAQADGVPIKRTYGGRRGGVDVGWTGTNPAGEAPDSNLAEPVKPKRKSPAIPWKKEKGFPKRPLSAYNLFFRDERQRLLDASTNRKLGFAMLAKTVASRWKTLDDTARIAYNTTAAIEKNLYNAAVKVWRIEKKRQQQQQKAEAEQVGPQAPKAEAIAFHPKTKAKGEYDDDYEKQRWEQAKIASASVPAVASAQSGVDDAVDQWFPSSLWEDNDDDESTSTPSTKHGSYYYETQQRHRYEPGNNLQSEYYTGTPSSTTATTWPIVTPVQRGEDKNNYHANEWNGGGAGGERRRSETPETTMNSAAGSYNNSYRPNSSSRGLFPKPGPPVPETYYQATGYNAPAYRGLYNDYSQYHYDAEYYTPPPPMLHQPYYYTLWDNSNNRNNNHPVATWSPHDTNGQQYFAPYGSDVVLAASAGTTTVGDVTTRTDDPAAAAESSCLLLESGKNRNNAAVASFESLPRQSGSPSSVGVVPTNLFGHLKEEEEEADDDDDDEGNSDSLLGPCVGLDNAPSTDEESDP